MTPPVNGNKVEGVATKTNPMGLSDEACVAIIDLVAIAEKEDEYIRLQQTKQFKKNNLFWHGFQYLFWSEIDQDWRIPTHEQLDEVSSREEVSWIYNYVINHFKAHGESIIAALSTDIPDVRFGPRDAEDPSDRRAVEAADNTAELIEKWNRAKLLIINALFYLATEGFVASYTYNLKDPEFGKVDIPQFGTRMEQTTPDLANCPQCGFAEPTTDQESGQVVHQMNDPCPQCGEGLSVQPGLQEEVPFMTGSKPVPKGREIVEIYGALNVRVPSYVPKQADAGWLLHYVDANPALLQDKFPVYADEISSDPGQNYERLMRQSSLAMEGFQLNVKLTTLKKCWIRKWYINNLSETDDAVKQELKSKFPDGIRAFVVDKCLLDAGNESMDKHWSCTKAGPSKGMHADPLLQSYVQIQELRNNLANLFIMQVEYGVPATYADPEVFDFEGQQRQEIAPGYVYPATPRPGQTMEQAFYTEKTTTLSKEATQLIGMFDTDGQFVTGDVPSIYGGAASTGSKTLGEYDRTRAFGLQRLGLVWYFINVWWAETIHKSVLSFFEHQIEDEPITASVPGGFQTKWIKKADSKGSFERLEPEASADFPVSFAQKRQVLMGLFQMQSDEINSVLFAPENLDFVKSVVGVRELQIPDSVQKNKQLREILYLSGMCPQEDGAGNIQSPVAVEPDIDDHEVHIKTLIAFLAGDTGQDLKENNPQGYASCMSHLLEHKQYVMQAQMAQMPQQPGAPGPTPPGAHAPVGPPKGAPAPPKPPAQQPTGVM